MPIISHNACTEPAGGTVVCRFMDVPKFRDLFANEELYLRRVDLFKETDPQEGLPSDEYIRAMRGLRKYDLRDELELNNDQAFNRQYGEANYINCWQIFDGETLHMWKTYGKGIVVFSRFDLLRTAINSFLDTVLIGVVRYGEKDKKGYNLIDFLFTKRQWFDKERELRIVLQSFNPVAGMNWHFSPNGFPNREPLDSLYPIHDWVHPYKRRRVELKSIVTEIRMSPWATEQEFEEVKLWAQLKHLPCPIKPSDLTSSLTPTLEELRKHGS